MKYNNFPLIGGIQSLSTIDFNDHLSVVIFLKGCNFNCFYCHNSELKNCNYVKVDEDISIKQYEKLFEILENKKGKLDGIVITGGEPTIWNNKLINLIAYLKRNYPDYDIKLDTNGSNFICLNYLIEEKLVNYIAMDIKEYPENYNDVINIQEKNISETLENIKCSLKCIKRNKLDHEFRITSNKTKEYFKNLIEYLKINDSKIYLQKIRNSKEDPYVRQLINF